MSTKLLAIVRDQVKSAEAEKNTLVKERDVRQAEADALVESAEGEKRDLDNKEAARFREVNAQIREIDAKLDNDDESDLGVNQRLAGLTERQAELQSHLEAREKSAKAADQWAERSVETERVGGSVRVRSEARTYSADSERRGTSFFRDLYASRFYGDPASGERLERHSREARLNELAGYEARDVGTGQFVGLTVPAYLTEMAAPVARAMRPTVEICNRHPLPDHGMTVEISRITTGTAAAAQSSQGDAVQETDADDTALSVPVRTYSGQQDVSRQALDRSTGVDNIITEDLVRAYWTTLDSAILNGAGTNGTHTGIRLTSSIETVSYAATTPTVAGLYPKLAQLISQIQSGVFMGVTHFVMAPRRWWWIASNIGTSFPLLNVNNVSTVQGGNVGSSEYAANNRNILGIPVVLDGSIPLVQGAAPSNEDVILGVTAPELHLWHDSGPLFIRAEQPGAATLQAKFVVYSYSAFTAGRYPGAHGTITSTGLAAPTFA